MHNRLMSNVGPCFFSTDLSQFLHVGLVLVNKHCPVFFFSLCSAENSVFVAGSFWRSFVERETKETFWTMKSAKHHISRSLFEPIQVLC